jgi:hypothetical protein
MWQPSPVSGRHFTLSTRAPDAPSNSSLHTRIHSALDIVDTRACLAQEDAELMTSASAHVPEMSRLREDPLPWLTAVSPQLRGYARRNVRPSPAFSSAASFP